MAKLRKMLGDINAPVIRSLMALIETQNGVTLGRWAIDYAQKNLLDIYKKAYPQDSEVSDAISVSTEFLDGTRSIKEVKALMKEVNQIARETEEHPAAQAAVRGIAAACSAVYSPTGALGYTFYAAAAIVYDKAGLQEKQSVYDAMAAEEFERILVSLEKAAITEEKNPVKINWNC